jgi:hypothetical protein
MREVIWLAGADADLQAIFDFLEERQAGRGIPNPSDWKRGEEGNGLV